MGRSVQIESTLMSAEGCGDRRTGVKDTEGTVLDIAHEVLISSCFKASLFPVALLFFASLEAAPTFVYQHYLHPYIQPEFGCLGIPSPLFIDLVALETCYLLENVGHQNLTQLQL